MDTNLDIAAEREALRLAGVKVSQNDIAEALGVNQSTVARWEVEPSRMKPFVVSAIREFLTRKKRSKRTKSTEGVRL